MLMLPMIVFAQKSVPSQRTTKYEDLITKSGVIFTTYTYPLDGIDLPLGANYNRLGFNIIKIVLANMSYTFLEVRHYEYGNAKISESCVKEWYNSLKKMNGMTNSSIPEGARAEYTYINTDGIVVSYTNKIWRIGLNTNKGMIGATDITPLITKLEEIIQKFGTIK